jgi:hypothetical protein
MELLPILRLVWRRRLAFAIGLCAAVAVFVALKGTKPARSATVVAWTRVALDTPKSQLVEVSPAGADTLAWRASLGSALMSSGTSTQQVARRLGVAADQVAVVDPAFTVPLVTTAMAQQAAAAARTVAPYVLTFSAANNSLPLISVVASGPDRAGSVRLAQAGVAVLESQASQGGSFRSQIATNAGEHSRQAFVVEQVAPMRVTVLTKSKLRLKAIGASLFVLLVTCVAVLLLPGERRRRRRLRARAIDGHPPSRRRVSAPDV